MSEPVKLPEPARLGLLDLYAKAQQAQQLYTVASNAALAALGFDPQAKNHLDLDTGTITPPEGG